MISRAEKLLDKESMSKLQAMIYESRDILLEKDLLVDVEPISIEIKGPDRLIKVRQRTCSPDQTTFLKKKAQKLINAGFIVRKNGSKWACVS